MPAVTARTATRRRLVRRASLVSTTDYLIAAIQAYEDGTRAEPMMHALTQALTRSQVEDIAYFYAAMIPRRAAPPAKGDPVAGMAVTAPCAGCHGVDGNSTDPKNPRLAGQNAAYLITAVNGYKDGSRKMTSCTIR